MSCQPLHILAYIFLFYHCFSFVFVFLCVQEDWILILFCHHRKVLYKLHRFFEKNYISRGNTYLNKLFASVEGAYSKEINFNLTISLNGNQGLVWLVVLYSGSLLLHIIINFLLFTTICFKKTFSLLLTHLILLIITLLSKWMYECHLFKK